MLNYSRARIGGLKINEIEFKVWISLIRNLGFKKYQKLIQEFGSKDNLWHASKKQLLKIEGIGEKLSNIISNKKIKDDLKRHIDYMQKNSIDIISIEDYVYFVLNQDFEWTGFLEMKMAAFMFGIKIYA